MRLIQWKLFIAVLLAAGCGGTESEPVPETPFTSAPGSPTGSPVTATIGAAGGVLQTPDGKVVVSVPAGALAADSQLSLTPTTNTLEGGVGGGYRLELGAAALAQPITATLSYDGLALPSGLGALRPAVQLPDGSWQAAGKVTLDETKKTLSFRTRFLALGSAKAAQAANLVRDLAMFEWFFIAPPAATVKTSESLPLTLETRVRQKPPATDPDEELAPLGVIKKTPLPNDNGLGMFTWSASDGSVQPGGSGATFTAPAKVPDRNPVAVSARFSGPLFDGMILVSNVRVVGGAPTFAGKVSFSYNTAAEDVSGTADLRFERFEDLPDVARYALLGGSFSFTVTPKYPDKTVTCSPKSLAEVPAAEGESNGVLILWKPSSSLGQKYSWRATSVAREISFLCRDKKGNEIPYTLSQIASLTTASEGIPYNDAKALEGSNLPLLATFGSGTATWRFEAGP